MTTVEIAKLTRMVVGVRVETEDLKAGQIRHMASAYLTFVALDDDFSPRPVPPMVLDGDEDRRRHRQAQARRRVRLAEKTREISCRTDPHTCQAP